jgi:Uma2 family endonuclease
MESVMTKTAVGRSGGPPKGGSYHFSPDQFFKMTEIGIFEGKRVELIGGKLREIPALSNHHAATIDELRTLLDVAYGEGYWVRAQATLNLAPHGVPDPDIAVVRGSRRNPTSETPSGALIVVEVSDSTLTYDRTVKASLYAASGVAEYWIVNIPGRQLEIRRDIQPDATQEFGSAYGTLTTLRPGATARPLSAPQGAIPVDRLFFE